jgi:hypothetical protein
MERKRIVVEIRHTTTEHEFGDGSEKTLSAHKFALDLAPFDSSTPYAREAYFEPVILQIVNQLEPMLLKTCHMYELKRGELIDTVA